MSVPAAPESERPSTRPGAAPDAWGATRGRSLQTVLLRPLILPFVLMLGVGLAVLLGVNRAAQSRTLVTDSQTRLILIGLLSGDIASMQNGTRGYVIAGKQEFLTPYTEGRLMFSAHAYALHDLSSAPQQLRLAQVQALVGRWVREAAEPQNNARKISLGAAAKLVSSGYGNGILAKARTELDLMQMDEYMALSAASTASQDTLNRVRLVTVVGLLLGVLLLLVTAWQVARTVSAMLNHLTDSARLIAEGQYHLRLPDSGVRELVGLGRQVEVMAAAVQQREQDLRVTNEKLERSNRELEQFAYVASHDLQEPLRTITSYTELLSRRYAGRLDERADQYMAFTTAATLRLKTLIQDLLTYSRVRQGERLFSPIDAGEVVAGVVDDLALNAQTSGAQVQVGPLPTVQANPELLRHIFQNLIGNALKFRAENRDPVVQVSAARDQQEWVFTVQDNGIGIEAQYHQRIFGVFQRLHGMDEYEGSGIGLAVTRTAVEQLGGRLWLDSEPGHGSTFRFSVPDAGSGSAIITGVPAHSASPPAAPGAAHGPVTLAKEFA
ncbi:ATP-binding protein [Deinococcus sp.]|uniref:sensor histidine kinase n=1 Tax=Deinococcus sp. TaxID=47478 RepID=UPI002869A8D5|nr:ATP-binding protein [Deinococcus sp.]